MRLNLLGYIDNNDEVEDYLSLEIPIFGNHHKQYVQLVDELTTKVVGFQDVTGIRYATFENDFDIDEGEFALYLYLYKKEKFVGTKNEADQFVSNKINTQNLSDFNLYSLYTFLGYREKVIETIDRIVAKSDNKLSHKNFDVPSVRQVAESNSVIAEQTTINYSNVFFSLTEANYTELLHIVIRRAVEVAWIQLGFYQIHKNFLRTRLLSFTMKLPEEDMEIRLNDFIVGLLICLKESLPEKSRFWNYIAEEVVKSDTYTNNDIVGNIKSVQVASSTNYFLMHPNAKIDDESFVFKSLQVEKSSGAKWANIEIIEVSAKEEEENDAIIEHIKVSNSKLISKSNPLLLLK